MLQATGGNKTLDAGSLSVLLAVLASDRAADNKLLEVLGGGLVLGETVELADVAGTLGTETAGDLLSGQTLDVLVTGLQNNERNDSHVGAQDGTVDRLPLTLTVTTGTVDLVVGSEEQTHTAGDHDTGHASETLLVVTTGDLQDVALGETELLTRDLLANAGVPKVAGKVLVIEVDKLLRAVRRIRNVELDHRVLLVGEKIQNLKISILECGAKGTEHPLGRRRDTISTMYENVPTG